MKFKKLCNMKFFSCLWNRLIFRNDRFTEIIAHRACSYNTIFIFILYFFYYIILYINFIMLFLFIIYIYSTISAKHFACCRRTSAANECEFSDCETVAGVIRVATLFYARWCVHAALRTLSCYLTDAKRRELCVRRKSARPLALVPSRQVVSQRRYTRQVLVSVPNFRFVRPFLVAFHHDLFNSSWSQSDRHRPRLGTFIVNQIHFQDWIGATIFNRR